MTYPLVALWHRFRDGFVAGLQTSDAAEVLDAWASQTARTAWYRRSVLQRLADELDLDLRAEFLRVDFSMWTREPDAVPVVFIESENLASTATDEVRKLCSVSAPLKVLLTCVEWGEHWPGGGKRNELVARWQALARAHHRVWPQEHVLGICVAEIHDSTLRVYTLALDGRGDVIEESTCALERPLDV